MQTHSHLSAGCRRVTMGMKQSCLKGKEGLTARGLGAWGAPGRGGASYGGVAHFASRCLNALASFSPDSPLGKATVPGLSQESWCQAPSGVPSSV